MHQPASDWHSTVCGWPSSITYGELTYGVQNSARPSQNAAVLEHFVRQVDVLALGTAAARHFGEIKVALKRAGTPICAYDVLIAAHARSLGLTLVTNNRREFDRIEGLAVEDWSTE